jgi:hypothetical protein
MHAPALQLLMLLIVFVVYIHKTMVVDKKLINQILSKSLHLSLV